MSTSAGLAGPVITDPTAWPPQLGDATGTTGTQPTTGDTTGTGTTSGPGTMPVR
ncbi:MAG: hypothetical protein JWP61_295 [Friedmanniella sp.]|nr:hypothetical protein [Friedmanniella sp.]